MAEHIWESKFRNKAQKIISYIISEIIKRGSINPFDFEYSIPLQWLAATSKNDKKILHGDAYHIIFTMSQSSERSIDDFESLFEDLVNNRKNLSPIRWSYAIPIYIKIFSHLKAPIQFKIYDNTIKIIKLDTIFKRFGKKKIYKLMQYSPNIYREINQSAVKNGQVITIDSEGNNAIDAWTTVHPSFELFLGILEFSSHIYQRFLHSTERSMRLFPTASWLLGFSSGNEYKVLEFMVDKLNLYPTNLLYPTSRSLQMYELNTLKKIAKLFRKKPKKPSRNPILHFLAECFRLYSQALEETLLHRRLLAFWQIAEHITLADRERGKTEVVYKGLAAFISHTYGDEAIHNYILRDISVKRNNVVHNGIYTGISDIHIDTLKFYCERAICFFLAHRKFFRNINDIELFFKYRTVNYKGKRDYNLKRMLKIIKDYNRNRGRSPF